MSTYTVSSVTAVAPEHLDAFWEMYLATFDGFADRSATRHVMTRDEFDHFANDTRVIKTIAFDDAGAPAGLTIATNDLDSIDWISPAFFAARYPDEVSRNALFYVALVIVAPKDQGGGLFPQLMAAMGDGVARVGGVITFDVCAFNEQVAPLPNSIGRFAEAVYGATLEELDTQRFYAVNFPEVPR